MRKVTFYRELWLGQINFFDAKSSKLIYSKHLLEFIEKSVKSNLHNGRNSSEPTMDINIPYQDSLTS